MGKEEVPRSVFSSLTWEVLPSPPNLGGAEISVNLLGGARGVATVSEH